MDKSKLLEQVEKQIDDIMNDTVQPSNAELLYQFIDIHKDIKQEEYWDKKGEAMSMRYDDYGRRGRYRGDYGRRGVPGTGRRYRGEEAIEEMQEHYENYNEAYDEANNGNYGAEGDMVDSVENIMESMHKILKELNKTGSPEVTQVIKKHMRKMMEEMD